MRLKFSNFLLAYAICLCDVPRDLDHLFLIKHSIWLTSKTIGLSERPWYFISKVTLLKLGKTLTNKIHPRDKISVNFTYVFSNFVHCIFFLCGNKKASNAENACHLFVLKFTYRHLKFKIPPGIVEKNALKCHFSEHVYTSQISFTCETKSRRLEKMAYIREENGFGRVSHVKYSQNENVSFTRRIFKTDRSRRRIDFRENFF